MHFYVYIHTNTHQKKKYKHEIFMHGNNYASVFFYGPPAPPHQDLLKPKYMFTKIFTKGWNCVCMCMCAPAHGINSCCFEFSSIFRWHTHRHTHTYTKTVYGAEFNIMHSKENYAWNRGVFSFGAYIHIYYIVLTTLNRVTWNFLRWKASEICDKSRKCFGFA